MNSEQLENTNYVIKEYEARTVLDTFKDQDPGKKFVLIDPKQVRVEISEASGGQNFYPVGSPEAFLALRKLMLDKDLTAKDILTKLGY
jgi:hypothetical protein